MRVLVTAGAVYGRLDDNKLVGNRARGIWALEFVQYLIAHGHEVTLVVPDTMPESQLGGTHPSGRRTVVRHDGFHSYLEVCQREALTHDAAVMAAAVVNWIPAFPVKGKMTTHGYMPGDIIEIPFILAPRVIERMRRINPKLTLIGCKMLSGSTETELIEAAYTGVIQTSKAHVVVANDLSNLRQKHLVYPDRCVQSFSSDWMGLYHHLLEVLQDTHWQTKPSTDTLSDSRAKVQFNNILTKYRDRFLGAPRDASGTVFGSLVVPAERGFLVSPRIKDKMFTAEDAVWTTWGDEPRTLFVTGGKATMNAPLLLRMAETYHCPVLHLHEQIPGVPVLPYAPPGTDRDTDRPLLPVFNIEGHGFVACLDSNLEFVRH